MTAQHRSADARRQDCLRHLFCFQRDVTAAALTVNTHQNFLVEPIGISTLGCRRNGALVESSNRMPL
jgi:hypothetical protein